VSLDFELSFAGIPFRPAIPEAMRSRITKYVDTNSLLNPPPGAREWDHVLPPAPQMPKLDLHELFYPWGARRFSCMYGLMGKADVDAALPLITNLHSDGWRSLPGTLAMKTGDSSLPVSTMMYMLPPEPIFGLDINNSPDLYLVKIVDERYWWRWTNVRLISEDRNYTGPNGTAGFEWMHTWDTVFQECADAAGITLDFGIIETKYGKPDAASPFFSFYQPISSVLDAACAHTGRVLCRKMDGTYAAVKYSLATTFAEVQRAAIVRAVGGLAYTSAQAAETVAANSSQAVALSRPRYVNTIIGDWDFAAGEDKRMDVNIPRGERTDFGWATQFTTQEPNGRKGYLDVGATASQYFSANIRQHGTAPPALIHDTLAADWYDWSERNLRETYRSIVSFDPQAGLDMLFRYTDGSTSVWCEPDNYEVTSFWHWDGTIIHEWPRSAVAGGGGTYGYANPAPGMGIGAITYQTAEGNRGGEWPRVKVWANAPSLDNGYYSSMPFGFGGGPAVFMSGEATSASYLVEGVFQSNSGGPEYGSAGAMRGMVWAGHQWLGTGVKHVGAIDLFGSEVSTPNLDYVTHGLIPYRGLGGGSRIAPNRSGTTDIGRGGVIVGAGSVSEVFSGVAANSAFLGPIQTQGLFSQGITLTDGCSMNGGGNGWSMTYGAFGHLLVGNGNNDSNDFRICVGEQAHGYQWPGVPNVDPRGSTFTLTGGSWGNIAATGNGQGSNGPGGLLTGYESCWTAVSGYTFSVGGAVAAGGYKAPLGAFPPMYATPVPGNKTGWVDGRSGYVPQNPGPEPFGFPGGSWGYPPDPAGPMLFASGLYIGGGGCLATKNNLAIANRALKDELEGQLETLEEGLKSIIAGTATRLRNNIIETLVGPGRWTFSSMGTW
jgi:hypothetical protein